MQTCLAFSIATLVQFAVCTQPTVHIPDGNIEGVTLQDYEGSKFYAFKRIPYAKPPIGQYRFRAAIKNDPWENVLNGAIDSPLCSQPIPDGSAQIGSEDCLYLNVFTPSLNFTSLKPVMVYIHGGAFYKGHASEFGAEYLMKENILLVTINYRLGVWGFINLVDRTDNRNEEELVANNGFKDQVLALKWIHKNIEYFGGDPKRVTIAGHSAGGMSVHSHILSPLSKGLFHQAIIMSGTSINPWVYTANNTAIDIAQYLNINNTNERSMIKELKLVSNEKLFEATKNLNWLALQLNSPCLIGLVIENPGMTSFMSSYPLKVIQSGNYNKVPMLIGNANKEGLIIHAIKGKYTSDLNVHIPYFFNKSQDIKEEIKQYYNINAASDNNNISFYTDIWFKFSTFRAAYEHSKINPVDNIYYYDFSGDGTLNYDKPILYPNKEYEGACHGDDLGYLFQCKSRLPVTIGPMEDNLIKLMTSTFGSFVKLGKPHKDWLPFSLDQYNFANFTNDGLKMGVLDKAPFHFWSNMYEKYSDEFH